jgi:hypothetical protein
MESPQTRVGTDFAIRKTMPLLDLPTPHPDATCAERVEFAGDRLWDLAEGKLAREQGHFYCQLIAGWTDLCSSADREQYRGMVRRFEQMLKGDK